MSLFYILKDKVPVPVKDVLEWAPWFEEHKNRLVKQETVPANIWVSTLFLGLDQGHDPKNPILFETMAFKNGKPVYDLTRRYRTWDEAIAGHEEIVLKIREPWREN